MRDFAKLRTLSWPRQAFAEVAAALLLGLVLAWLGPFRTNEREFLPRLGYWTAMAAFWLAITASVGVAFRRSHRLGALGPWHRRLLTLFLSGFLLIFLAVPATHALTGWRPAMGELIELYAAIILLGALVSYASDAMVSFISRVDIILHPPTTADAPYPEQTPASLPSAPPDQPRLIQRLPAHLRSMLLCLSMEDHYVRVRTQTGSSLMLMTLTDAIGELDALPGAQVHRSWWVAEQAVAEFVKKGRNASLRLNDGTIVPVSQPHLDVAQEMAHKKPPCN